MKETETESRLLPCANVGQIEVVIWKSIYNDYRSRNFETSKNKLRLELIEFFYYAHFQSIGGSLLWKTRNKLRSRVMMITSEIKDKVLSEEVKDFLFFIIEETVKIKKNT